MKERPYNKYKYVYENPTIISQILNDIIYPLIETEKKYIIYGSRSEMLMHPYFLFGTIKNVLLGYLIMFLKQLNK